MRKAVAVAVALGAAIGVSTERVGGTEFPGTAPLMGRAKLKVRPCGKATDDTVLAVAVAPDGAWVVDDGARTFAGTGTILGKAGRKLALALDEASLTSLVGMLEVDASTLCGGTVTATEVTARKMLLKVNAKGTRARLVLVVTAVGTADDGTSGKAKFRVVAKGDWTGPLSCEEIFACTQACPIDDSACAETCIEQGTLATQEDVTALEACVASACPTGGPVCVAAALAGVCKSAYETCVPPPPPSDLTCEEIFDCARDCEGQRCVDDCFDRGSERGRDEAIAVSTCINRVCPHGGAACQASAVAGACAYVWEDCTGTSPPRNLGCAGILDCMTTCPVGSAACLTDCRDRGSTIGQARLLALDQCIDAACPTRAPACVANTVTGQCHAEWQSCAS